jgi:hypothetical protein
MAAQYTKLRRSASLDQLAKVASSQAQAAQRQWLKHRGSLLGKSATPDELARLDEIGHEWAERLALARHLNRLARTAYPSTVPSA